MRRDPKGLYARAQAGQIKTFTLSVVGAVDRLSVRTYCGLTALDAVQTHGGYGYKTEYEIERAPRDAIKSTIYGGLRPVPRASRASSACSSHGNY